MNTNSTMHLYRALRRPKPWWTALAGPWTAVILFTFWTLLVWAGIGALVA